MTPAYIVSLALSLRIRQCFVAVCMAATTKRTNVQMLSQTALFRHSLPSIHKTARNVTIYVAIDDDDIKLMKWKNTLSRFAKVIAKFATVVVFPSPGPELDTKIDFTFVSAEA